MQRSLRVSVILIMIFQYASDLHLEFPRNKKTLKRQPILANADTLILAGDIMPFIRMDEHNDFWNYISDNFKQAYWLAGNHEYYGFDAATKQGSFCENIRSNISLINNESVIIDNIEFVFSTLWSHIGPLNQYIIQRRMNDFSQINFDGAAITPLNYNLLHEEAVKFLKQTLLGTIIVGDNREVNHHLNKNGFKKVIVTHHLPTLLNYPNKYKNDPIKEGFATELYDLIEASNAACWIYGHHHHNTPTFSIGNTQMITNQLGYVQYHEHSLFKRDAVFEV